ncbi:MAG: hypothetical protein J7D60_10155 [Prosthecochloris sp.]|nr:hypothetical protein [Prosthecochloris sp.]
MKNTLKKTIATALFAAAMVFTNGNAFAVVVDNGNGASQGSKSFSRVKQEGKTDVKVTVPDFLVLHYFNNVSLNFGNAAGVGTAKDEGTFAFDVDWNGDTKNSNNKFSDVENPEGVSSDYKKVQINLPGMWAVRGLSPSGKANISIAIENADMTRTSQATGVADSKITMSKATVSSEANIDGNGTASMDVPLHIARNTVGNVGFELDFSKTTLSGEHQGGKYTITATTI